MSGTTGWAGDSAVSHGGIEEAETVVGTAGADAPNVNGALGTAGGPALNVNGALGTEGGLRARTVANVKGAEGGAGIPIVVYGSGAGAAARGAARDFNAAAADNLLLSVAVGSVLRATPAAGILYED